MEHTPALAADPADRDAPRRSLILAGGGMRVAWQAGVLCALEESGLAFAHADGTSGGTINLAMLLSGRAPREMSDRWRSLRVRDFASPLALREYLRAPRLSGFAGADGIVDRVFPHLGIDVDAIRSARGIEGTFNVCNHAAKTNEAIGHREVDLDVLVAGISLPMAMPAVRRGGIPYVDAVWIKDANLMGAVKRGAEELWLLWCIGNTPAYRDGPFHQYVHMIEQSANGVLFEELDRIADLNAAIRAGHSPYGQRHPVIVHVVKPHHPIPLDPAFFLGRIDAATLVAMGYRDARRYLATMDGDRGVGLTPEATRMEEPGVRVFWRERYSGPLGRIQLVAEVPDAAAFVAGPRREARLVGRVRARGVGDALLHDGRAALEAGALVYEGAFEVGGRELVLRGRREAPRDGSLAQRLRSLRRLSVELREGTGGTLVDEGQLRPDAGRTGPLPLPIVMNVPSVRRRLTSAAAFERVMAAELLGSPSTDLDPAPQAGDH
ncbi:MAG: patatin-like phospholipase family protein [Solirubrobacteraceae bacterium MAG38_C4-C5]|nr:patatin-like phospholipase family protein [Candidatus Siliceabacter maunaloa]